ncbi:diaminopimelate decarboxylase [Dubosiella newyorkensis]|uniref:diaminopimelate decarboxylase n=1 Tax=Dubosiella newyorkensis TaxID=1862672 RepID=UPI0023F524C0|nr:diaminopimelate decarboxylase [Dubosiella newyorkensis]
MIQTKNNQLYIEGLSFKDLADQYGTPLYIYDQAALEKRMETYYNTFTSPLFETKVLYASKAFLCKAMVKLAQKHSLCLDVVSGGELYIAKQAGFNMDRVYFHGNNKTEAELRQAIDYGVHTIVLDNLDEAKRLVRLSQNSTKPIHALLRINPGIEAHTHAYIVTAHIDSKFGILKSEIDTIEKIIQTCDEADNVIFDGFHAHIGSQIFDPKAFIAEIETMAEFIATLQKKMERTFSVLDLGGGFAAYYTQEDAPIPIETICPLIVNTCEAMQEKYSLSLKEILIEPGRSIVAEAGYSLYTIGSIKKTPHKQYAFVDGGMSDNIRPALYQAAYRSDLVEKMDQEKKETYCIAGKCCESGDILIERASLPLAEENDLLVVYTTGAYGYSMASNYNALCIPAIVFVKDGQSKLVVRRQCFEDLIEKDMEDPV